MKIDSTEFCSITINGTSHDILISMSGEVSWRNLQPAPGNIGYCNKTRDKAIGLFHVTC